ncbi:MAG TPA: hypothetical protein DCO83_12825 [Mucilaginibacter sp.]|nr:hypothetical protein [Mucilaginibacter sp.]
MYKRQIIQHVNFLFNCAKSIFLVITISFSCRLKGNFGFNISYYEPIYYTRNARSAKSTALSSVRFNYYAF